MFTRVTTFETDPGRIDEIATWLQGTWLPMGHEQFEGHRGVLMAADRAAGTMKLLAFWDSDEALRASEAEAGRIRDERVAVWEGSNVDLAHYEVVADEPAPHAGGQGLFVRATTMQGDASSAEDTIAYIRDRIVPATRKLDGNRGVLQLLDRETGRGVTLTFWESREAMRTSEQAADELRDGASADLEADVVRVDRLEVVLDARR